METVREYPRFFLTAEVSRLMEIQINRTLLNKCMNNRFPREDLRRASIVFTPIGLNEDGQALTTGPFSSPHTTLGEFQVSHATYGDGNVEEEFRININAPLVMQFSEMGLDLVNEDYLEGISAGFNMSAVLVHELEHFYEHIQRRLAVARPLGSRLLEKLTSTSGTEQSKIRLAALEEEERVRQRVRTAHREMPEFLKIVTVSQKSTN